LPSRVRHSSIQLSRHSKWDNSISGRFAEPSQTDNVTSGKKGENGMLLDLLGGRRDRLLFICQATVPVLIILITAVSCSGPAANMPPPVAGIVDLISGGVTETPKQDASKATSRSASRPASKKATARPQGDDHTDELYQKFLEWEKRRKDQP
jgi:hypothetical protein